MSGGGKKEIKYVILKSSSGLSILDRKNNPNVPLKKFLPNENVGKKTAEILRRKGFEVVYIGLTHIAIRGTRVQFQKEFGLPKSELGHGPSTDRTARFEEFEIRRSLQPTLSRSHPSRQPRRRLTKGEPKSTEPEVPPDLARFVKAIGSQVPIKLLNRVGSPSAKPPELDDKPDCYYLKPPDDIARLLANGAHSRNIKGNRIKIALIDSGFMMPFHPYFKGRGYTIEKVMAFDDDERPEEDFYGHGTAMASCILAVAPKATLIPIKACVGTEEERYPPAFEKAIHAKPKPHIISCSWGYTEDMLLIDPSIELLHTIELLDALIDLALQEGITVLCASGNYDPDHNKLQWPSSKPNVISIGGAYIDKQGQIMASDFAVSGVSKIYSNRRCPDCCGLCGMKPIAAYIALPVRPKSDFDIKLSRYKDHTTTRDGWAITSGTSAATALAAGVAALWMQANPSLKHKPDKVKQQLMKYCRPIQEGTSSTCEPANLATGAGLVQAF